MRTQIRRILNAIICFTTVWLVSLLVMGRSGKARTEQLTIAGSSTIAPIIAEVAGNFESLYPEVMVNVETGGSARGILDVRKGAIKIGMVSRTLLPDESDINAYTIALDGVCVIVSQMNAVRAFSTEQLRDVFTGEIQDWERLGAPPGGIVVVNKAEGRSTLEVFRNYLEIQRGEIAESLVVGDNEQMIKTVASTPLAIGYVSIGAALTNVKLGVPIRLLAIDGIEPSIANVKNGRFPLMRELNLVTKVPPCPLAEKFILYLRDPKLAEVIERLGYVPYSP